VEVQKERPRQKRTCHLKSDSHEEEHNDADGCVPAVLLWPKLFAPPTPRTNTRSRQNRVSQGCTDTRPTCMGQERRCTHTVWWWVRYAYNPRVRSVPVRFRAARRGDKSKRFAEFRHDKTKRSVRGGYAIMSPPLGKTKTYREGICAIRKQSVGADIVNFMAMGVRA
jgi:hypothetical protein